MRILPAVMLLMIGCTQPVPVATSTEGARSQPASLGPRVILPNGSVISVEVVADDELRAQGLMHRDHLRPDAGMLFLFGKDERHSFWMKNTLIPLDMIFLDANRRIVGIERDVPPCKVSRCPSYGPDADSRSVLELAAGVAKQQGLRAGDVLRFEGTDGVEIR